MLQKIANIDASSLEVQFFHQNVIDFLFQSLKVILQFLNVGVEAWLLQRPHFLQLGQPRDGAADGFRVLYTKASGRQRFSRSAS